MMLKEDGAYVIYNNLEYELSGYDDDGKVIIISFNLDDLNKGFALDEAYPREGVFIKSVDRREITAGYSMENSCSYKGYKFQVVMESELGDEMLINTCDQEVYKKLKFDMREPGMYEKWIDIKELDKIWSEKKPMGAYPMP